MKSNSPIVFIVGTGRCGSSLIHEILSRHEDAGFISNIDDRFSYLNLKGRYNSAFFRSFIGQFTRKGYPRFAPSEAYHLISRQVSTLYAHSCRDLDSRDVSLQLESCFRKFFNDRIAAQNKATFLHKYTGWSRISFFHRIFPEAKFIHIIRDGRAVANSFLQMPWWKGYQGPENWIYGMIDEPYYSEWINSGKSFVTLAAITWKILLESYEISRNCLDDTQYYQLQYEDFLDDPRDALQNILDFCGLTMSPSFDKHFTRQVITDSRKAAYQTDLTDSQCRELEGCISAKLLEYGYALDFTDADNHASAYVPVNSH